jgi:acetolactate decarboxylase
MRRLISNTFIAITICSLLALACKPKDSEAVAERTEIVVKSAGKLMEIMHQGNVEAQIALDTIAKEHLYGLGAIAGLKGELTVIDGQPFVASVDSIGPKIVIDAAAKAALFVYAYVQSWDTLSLIGADSITVMIEEELKRRSSTDPFPFIILAQPNKLNYHIINFTGEQPNKSNHKQGALRGGIADQAVQILGFYASNKEGIYTHHGSKLHMHFLGALNALSGHVDSLNITEGPIKLLLPSL